MYRRTAHIRKNFPTESGAVGGLVIDEDAPGVGGVLERLVRKECRHAKLRVTRQHPEDGIKRRIEPILLSDAGAQLLGYFVAQRVRDDDDSLLVVA